MGREVLEVGDSRCVSERLCFQRAKPEAELGRLQQGEHEGTAMVSAHSLKLLNRAAGAYTYRY